MRRNRVPFVVVALVSIVLASIFQPLQQLPALAQGGCQTFRETGQTVCGHFFQYWQQHGGLMQQGFPVSGDISELSPTDGKTYTVQYFERAVFEYHPELRPPNDVLLSLLGNFLYQQKYPGGAPGQGANGSAGSVPFSQTGHRVGGGFLAYWKSHGGLAQQGYPISEEFIETSDINSKPYKVQYFERAELEYHPENPSPYNILLSQLGTLMYRQKYASSPNSSPNTASSPTTQPVASGMATSAPAATFTYTAVPPTATDTNTPRPAKTPTTCPALTGLSLECHDTGTGFAYIRWSVNGGSGRVEGQLTIEEVGGRTEGGMVGRSGERGFGPGCGFYPPYATLNYSIELHDECGQSVSASGSSSVLRGPCP
jgi:hypothetical protein